MWFGPCSLGAANFLGKLSNMQFGIYGYIDAIDLCDVVNKWTSFSFLIFDNDFASVFISVFVEFLLAVCELLQHPDHFIYYNFCFNLFSAGRKYPGKRVAIDIEQNVLHWERLLKLKGLVTSWWVLFSL